MLRNHSSVTGGWVLDRNPPERVLDPASLGPIMESDLREFCGTRTRDRVTSACAAHAVANAGRIRSGTLSGIPEQELSSLALYYWARLEDYPVPTWGSGVRIEQAISTSRTRGIPREALWPWNQDHLKSRPPVLAETGRRYDFQKITSTGVDRVSDVIRCLAGGRPIVFGTQVGSQWDRYRITLSQRHLPPLTPEHSHVGHVTVLVGYKDGLFIGENSWGDAWGLDGFYFADPSLIASDTSGNFWVID